MFDSPVIGRRNSRKRSVTDSEEETDYLEHIKKPKKQAKKMSDSVTINDLHELYGKIANKIESSERTITNRVDSIQRDVTTMKDKQERQDQEIKKLSENHDNFNNKQSEVIKRLEQLEKGEKIKPDQRSNHSAYHERLRELVAKSFMKIAIYDIPDDKDAEYIRKQADDMKITQELKDEIKNNQIDFIPDKRPAKDKQKGGKLYHLTTSGLQSRQAIIHAAKNKPGKMRWDLVIPKEFRIGYNKQKSMVWQLRNALNLSVQQEIHGHTVYVYINEKSNTNKRRVLSEFTPVEKPQRPRRGINDMDTNIDMTEDDKPILMYQDNMHTADDLASIIFWTGMKYEDDEDNILKMTNLAKIMSVEDFALINTKKTIHTKYQSRLSLGNKENATYVYDKYKLNADMPEGWDWSIFKLADYKLE